MSAITLLLNPVMQCNMTGLGNFAIRAANLSTAALVGTSASECTSTSNFVPATFSTKSRSCDVLGTWSAPML